MGKTIIGISDMKVSRDPEELLITFSLGSCIGVVIWDPLAKVGGLLHYMLPQAKLDEKKARKKPYMFANTGIPLLFKEAYRLGAKKNHLQVKAFGGSQLLDSSNIFNIGQRNYQIMRRMFEKNNIKIAAEDIGGSVNRTVSLEIGTGRTVLKVSGRGEVDI